MPADHVSELLGAYALHALEPHEARMVEVHLAACAECRAEAAQLGEAANSLALLAPPASAGTALRDRVMDRAGALADPPEPRRHPRRVVLAAAAALIALVGVAASGIFMSGRGTSVPRGRTVALDSTTAGTMRLVLGDDGDAYVVATGVPTPAAGLLYEGWWIVDGRPVAAGTFRAGRGETVNRLGPRNDAAVAFAVTIENGMQSSPAGPQVADGALRS